MNLDILTDPAASADFDHLRELPEEQQYKTLLKWLTGTHERRSSLAVAILAHGGRSSTQLLIHEIMAKGRREKSRITMLEAIERIGRPLDTTEWFDLLDVAHRYGPAVQKQVFCLLCWNRQASTYGLLSPLDSASG